MTPKERVMENLIKYEYIKKYLGKAVIKRLEIRGYTHGMLTSHFLDPNEYTKSDLDRLELVLQFGYSCCKEFNSIFQERELPNEDSAIDREIINLLAEVKAFEILSRCGFTDIVKIRHKKDLKTVDFTAKRSNHNYGIEVTRLGLASSERKKPQLDKLSRLPWLTIIDSKEPQNRMRIAEDIYDEVTAKHPQIREFCQKQGDLWKGILVISNGRDYFVAGRYENKLHELQPHTVCQILKQVWKLLEEENAYNYLHHIIITMGKDIGKAIVYPILN